MIPARKLAIAPPAPASHTRAVGRTPLPSPEEHAAALAATLAPLRARARRALESVQAELDTLRSQAAAQRAAGASGGRHGTLAHAAAAELEARADAIAVAAEELAWYAAGCPLPSGVRP